MAAQAIGFVLFVIIHSGSALSMTKLQTFADPHDCNRAAEVIRAAVGPSDGVEIACLSEGSLEALRAANR
jgi:hypothetical protein